MIGNKIKELRKKNNMTQIELSELLNIEQSTLANYENNKRSLKPDILKSIALIFNVTTDYLLGLTSSPTAMGNTHDEYLLDDEKKLLDTYRSLTSDEKQIVLGKALDLKISSANSLSQNKKKGGRKIC